MVREKNTKTINGTAVAMLSVNHDAGFATVRPINGDYIVDVLLDDLILPEGEPEPQPEESFILTCPHCGKSVNIE